MRNLKFFAIIAILSSISIHVSAQSSSDIAYIINTFVSNNKGGFVDWSIFNDNNKMRRYDRNLVDSEILPFQFRHKSILTMNGKPIFYNEVGDGGEWSIGLHGARVGASILHIETFFLYKNPQEILQYLSQKLSLQKLSSLNDDYSDFSVIYKVKSSFLKFSYSVGATGCGFMDIYVSKDLDDIRSL